MAPGVSQVLKSKMWALVFLAMLTANAAFGEAIVGRQLAEAAGLDQDGIRRFRAWFAKLLNDHLGDKD